MTARVLVAGFALLSACTSEGVRDHGPAHAMDLSKPRVPGGCEAPSAENHGRHGCYFDAAVDIDPVSAPVFWYVDEYPHAAAARAASTKGSAVVHAYGRVFLETVSTDPDWRATGGRRHVTLGPLPVPAGVPLTARYMQGMTAPGVRTRPHRHSGPEAFFLLDGSICLETPSGTQTIARGQTGWLAGASAMQLSSGANGIRRSLLVVIHPTAQAWMTVMPDWQPKGGCAGAG